MKNKISQAIKNSMFKTIGYLLLWGVSSVYVSIISFLFALHLTSLTQICVSFLVVVFWRINVEATNHITNLTIMPRINIRIGNKDV